MLRLSVHTDSVSAGTHGAGGVFYTQRAGGPHYRWRLDEEGLGQWRFTRLQPSEWNPKALFHSNQKEMPAALQARLAEHYMW
ncbi:MAG: hypothetical protein M3444_15315 [Acidobacteriota bacterium]|nr:hypothetical protein [Acidobacteriota bacterium]